MSFPALNLTDAQKSEVTEKLKKILPIYQKIDLIISSMVGLDSAKVNIQKLSQLVSTKKFTYRKLCSQNSTKT